MSVADAVACARTLEWRDPDGGLMDVVFLPALTSAEVNALEAELGGKLPADFREMALLIGGIECSYDIAFRGDADGQYLEGFLDRALYLAPDGCGNSFNLDVTSAGSEKADIFFACHDAPVMTYVCHGMEAFLDLICRNHSFPQDDTLDRLIEDRIFNVWTTHDRSVSVSQARESSDQVVRDFAASLPDGYFVVDLRDRVPGSGVPWGRFGPETDLKRCGEELIFGYGPAARSGVKKPWWKFWG